MHSYLDKHGHFPPAVVYGPDGTPWHSWRVLLLPHMDNELYKKFKLDEPWDSPHNLALVPHMPSAYAPPWDYAGKVGAHETVVHVFHGPGAAFEGKEGLSLANFRDLRAATILIIEGGPPIPWTKPEEIAYDPAAPLPELATLFEGGFRVILADASGRWVPRETSEKTLRALITRSGKDRPGADW